MKFTAILSFILGLFSAASAGAAVANSPLDAVRYEQRLGDSLPLAVPLVDETGATRPLGDFFRRQPVVVWFDYARCPQLCSVVGDGLSDVLRRLRPSVGRDYTVLSISIDPTDSWSEAATRRLQTVGRYGRTGSGVGWHYLVGSERSVEAVAAAAGFRYIYDPRSRQYAHPSGFMVVTPTGKISKYFLGVDFPAAEVAAALDDAAAEKTGERVFDLVLRCFRGEGIGGRYGRIIWAILSVAVGTTVVALAGGIGGMLWQERRRWRAVGKVNP